MQLQTELRRVLLEEFEAKRARNSAYSLRAYARFLNVPTSGLSDIFSGKRRITRRMCTKIAARLPLKPSLAGEIQKFIRHETSGKAEYSVLDAKVFSVVASWHYFAILTASELDNFDGTPEWIAKNLGLSVAKAREGLNTLQALNLLARDEKGRLRPTHQNLATTMDIPDAAIQRSHREHLQLAEAALGAVAVGARDFSFVNIATDPLLVVQAKEKIKKFRRELCAFLESSPRKKSAVLRLGIQLFPVTTGGTK
jgi:uncharacterized protein (TIGR02147 family)